MVSVMGQNPTIDEVREALEASWGRDTSASPDRWRSETACFGQCAVTALVLGDYFHGRLLRAVVNGESHYWLRTTDGEDLDLTLDQFQVVRARTAPVVRDRIYVLSFEDTAARYRILAERVAAKLENLHAR